jgi:hypothetical protein
MPESPSIDKEWEKDEPAPQRQRAIRPLAKETMGASAMSEAENQEIEAQPDGDEEPSTLNHANKDQGCSEKCQKMPVAHGEISAWQRKAKREPILSVSISP